MAVYDILTCEEVAAELRLSSERVRQFCRHERIGKRLGGRWVIHRSELDQFKKIPREPGRPAESKRKSA